MYQEAPWMDEQGRMHRGTVCSLGVRACLWHSVLSSLPTGMHPQPLSWHLRLCLAALPHLLAVSFLARPCVLSGLGGVWQRLWPPPWWGRGALEHVFLGGRHQLAGDTFAYSTEPPRAKPGLWRGGCGRTEGEGRLWSARGQAEQISDWRDRWLKQEKGEGSKSQLTHREAFESPEISYIFTGLCEFWSIFISFIWFLIAALQKRYYCYPHFTDEETEKSYTPSSRPQAQSLGSLGIPGLPPSQSQLNLPSLLAHLTFFSQPLQWGFWPLHRIEAVLL